MVENTLRMIDPSVSYRAVWASRGKVTRAEPISALYEQGRVHHVGAFPRLEDQMCAFTIDFDRGEMGYSPDRVDALVWALTELMIEGGERRLLMA
jgi:phage terminase large subunit-like protein